MVAPHYGGGSKCGSRVDPGVDPWHHIGRATAPPDSTLAAWPYLQGGKATGHAHAHAHTLMPHTQRSYPPDAHPVIHHKD